MKTRTLLFLPTCLCALALSARANDWPQWGGPNRNNVSQEMGLLKEWPEQGPKLLWTFQSAGEGYSGPAVVGDRVYLLGSKDSSECVFALEVNSGKEIWSCPIGPLFENAYGNGPRSTATVDGTALYALGGQGTLVCVDVSTGKKNWEVSLPKDLKGEMMSGWGYSESPLVDGDQVVCCPGGPEGTMAALDKKTGKVLWRSKELTDRATYSSIVVAEVGGVRQYVQTAHKRGNEGAIVGVSAHDGKLLWYYPRSGYSTAVVPTPIVRGSFVYATAGYGAGCDLLEIQRKGDAFKAVQKYSRGSQRLMKNQHGGVVLVKDHIYGYSDGPGWVCQDFKTGAKVWEDQVKVERGALTCAGGYLYCYSEGDGNVALVPATPEGMKGTGKFQIPRKTTIPRNAGQIWTHPVVANGRLYLRDQDLVFCYDVKSQPVGRR